MPSLCTMFNTLTATYELSHTLSVLFSCYLRELLPHTPVDIGWTASIWTLMLHPGNVYRCCPLPNLRNSNKLHSVQRVKMQQTKGNPCFKLLRFDNRHGMVFLKLKISLFILTLWRCVVMLRQLPRGPPDAPTFCSSLCLLSIQALHSTAYWSPLLYCFIL